MSGELGRYEILEEIGQGGFAIVYRARDTQLDRLVALKELRSILLHDKEWVKRFRREARTIARLDHPRIVTIHDVGEVEERLFIVMRLVDGPSLEELISTRGHFSWSEAVEVIIAVAEGLDYAHTQGILHRDLKPANILIDPERGPMLSDFGLAKLVGDSSMSMSASGTVVGTPHYIAPEVWEGQSTSWQSDIYAMGCILSEMLTGEKVFKGETPPAVMMAHFRPPALPKAWPAGVPPGVTSVLRTALAGRPVNRYATVNDMTKALLALSETAPQPGQANVIAKKQQELAPVAKLAQQPDEILMEDNLESVEQTSARQSTPNDTLFRATAPQPPLPKRKIFPTRLDLQKLEDTIADLPPQWNSFLKGLSISVIITFMLAIVNLLTSSYPWFIWPALAFGIISAIRFVNILFDDKKEAVISPPSVVQADTPPPAAPTSTTAPVAGLKTPVLPLAPDEPVPPPLITSTVPSSEPQTPSGITRARDQRKRSGCARIGIIFGGIFLILVIGVGGFCSIFSNIFNSAIPTIEVGTTLTENINITVPDTSHMPNLSLEVWGGQFFLKPGAENKLVEGTITYNVPQLKPKIETNGSNIRIYPEEDIGLSVFGIEGLENVWDLKLGSGPMELAVDVGGADTEIELESLSLANLTVTHGGGNFHLSFSKPNQIEMKNLQFKGGASSATLAGLANARAKNISFEAGGGDFTLDFSGELQNDVDVNIASGLGAVTIIIPENVAAQISTSGELSNINARGTWQKSGDNEYILPGEGHKITITAEIGLGSLELRTP
jgi:serine/threonine protein kinase